VALPIVAQGYRKATFAVTRPGGPLLLATSDDHTTVQADHLAQQVVLERVFAVLPHQFIAAVAKI
jgi:hypothetical protein